MRPDPDNLDSALTSLAADVARTQVRLDTSYAEEWQRRAPELAQFLASAQPGIPSALGSDLMQAVLPPRLRVESYSVSFRCELRAHREVAGGIAVRPLNLGYEARFGSTESWAANLRLEVASVPPPSASSISSVKNH